MLFRVCLIRLICDLHLKVPSVKETSLICTALIHIRPQELDVSAKNIIDELERYTWDFDERLKALLPPYVIAKIPPKQKIAAWMVALGPRARECLWRAREWAPIEDEDDLATVKKKIVKAVSPPLTRRLADWKFWSARQRQDEPVEDFIGRLQVLTVLADWDESMVQDSIIVRLTKGLRSRELRRWVLDKLETVTVLEVKRHCRAVEALDREVQALKEMGEDWERRREKAKKVCPNINEKSWCTKVRSRTVHQTIVSLQRRSDSTDTEDTRKTKKGRTTMAGVVTNASSDSNSDSEDEMTDFSSDSSSDSEDEVQKRKASKAKRSWSEIVTIEGKYLKMKVDSGSTISIVTLKDFRSVGLREDMLLPTRSRIYSYSGNVMLPLGKMRVEMALGGRTVKAKILVIEEASTSLLGYPDCVNLGLLGGD